MTNGTLFCSCRRAAKDGKGRWVYESTGEHSIVPVVWVRKIDLPGEVVEESKGSGKRKVKQKVWVLTQEESDELIAWCHYSDDDISDLPPYSQALIRDIRTQTQTQTQAEAN